MFPIDQSQSVQQLIEPLAHVGGFNARGPTSIPPYLHFHFPPPAQAFHPLISYSPLSTNFFPIPTDHTNPNSPIPDHSCEFS
jgi:hypothetical protein